VGCGAVMGGAAVGGGGRWWGMAPVNQYANGNGELRTRMKTPRTSSTSPVESLSINTRNDANQRDNARRGYTVATEY